MRKIKIIHVSIYEFGYERKCKFQYIYILSACFVRRTFAWRLLLPFPSPGALFQVVHHGHVHHVGIALGGFHAFVAKELLHGGDVYAAVHQQGGVGVARGVEQNTGSKQMKR